VRSSCNSESAVFSSAGNRSAETRSEIAAPAPARRHQSCSHAALILGDQCHDAASLVAASDEQRYACRASAGLAMMSAVVKIRTPEIVMSARHVKGMAGAHSSGSCGKARQTFGWEAPRGTNQMRISLSTSANVRSSDPWRPKEPVRAWPCFRGSECAAISVKSASNAPRTDAASQCQSLFELPGSARGGDAAIFLERPAASTKAKQERAQLPGVSSGYEAFPERFPGGRFRVAEQLANSTRIPGSARR